MGYIGLDGGGNMHAGLYMYTDTHVLETYLPTLWALRMTHDVYGEGEPPMHA